MGDNLFQSIEKKSNVKKEDIVKLAKSIQGTDLKDENNLRQLIKNIASMAGKEVSKEKEDKIIEAVKKDKVPKNLDKIIK
jgi:predicted transcriptional regulator